MKGADVSFVMSDGLGDPVVGLIRGAQCNECPLSSVVFLQEPAASVILVLVQRGLLWPQVCISVVKR